jgi:pyruvate dehydrogenase E1 component beta subunit
VREALREAMAEEMRADPTVFLMGEEVGEYQGAYKISQGPAGRVRPKRVVDTPITEMGFAGMRRGRVVGRAEADRRVHDLQLRDAGDRPHHQLGREDAVHVGRADGLPIVFRGPNGAAARVGAQHSQDYAAWYAHSGPEGLHALFGGGREGPAEGGDPRPEPGGLPGNEILYGRSFEVPVDPISWCRSARRAIMRAGRM